MIPRLGRELIASLSSAEVSERLALVATQSRGHPRRADQLWEEEKKKHKKIMPCACTHARTHEQNLMGKCDASRLDFTLRFQLPAGSCYQPHSRAHVRDRLTPERASALTERKLLQQQHLHPRQNTLPLPLRSVAPQPCTPLVFSVVSPFSCEI